MYDNFEEERKELLLQLKNDKEWNNLSSAWRTQSSFKKYTYNFNWMGMPIIQHPVDMAAVHEIIWNTQPDLIIECGVARGGSLIFYSSLLELNSICGGPQNAHVIGIDIDIRPHNRNALEKHPMFKRITLLEGSSISQEIVSRVHMLSGQYKNILVILDSNHTHAHVLSELEAYAPLVTPGNYCIVFDTVIEFMPSGSFPDRSWDKGDNPMTAVNAYLKKHQEFVIDEMIDVRLQLSMAPQGYLRRMKI